MYKTAKEIFNQYEALKKTYKYLNKEKEAIKNALKRMKVL